MSHTATVSAIKIVSIPALRAAVADLAASGVRCELRENHTPRAYYKDQAGLGQADYVLVLHDSKYDVGFYKQADGAYRASTDFFNRQVENVLGAQASAPELTEQARMGKLFQNYSVHVTMETAKKQGHMVTRHQRADGTIALTLTSASM